MNQDKFEKKLYKKYGTSKEELKDLNVSKIKNLQVLNAKKIKETKKFKFIRNIGNTLIKGGTIGAGVAGTINTVFPNIIPVTLSAITSYSEISNFGKLASYIGAASKPIAMISGPTIIGIGAGLGAVLYGGFKLVKNGVNKLSIISDRNKAKRLCK